MYRHLLVAVDGSLTSESAFKQALVFAKEMGASITILRAIPEDHLLVYQAEMLGAHQAPPTDQARKNAAAYLDGLEMRRATPWCPAARRSPSTTIPTKPSSKRRCSIIAT